MAAKLKTEGGGGTPLLPNPRKTGAVARWDAELARFATEAAKNESDALGGRWITQRAGQLSYAGEPLAKNEVDLIVLDAIHENVYYAEAFDADNPTSPTCYAFAREEAAIKAMVPHADAPDKQSPTCAACWANKFGSAEKGRGKACKNVRRIAVIPGDALRVDVIAKADLAFMKLPVLSVPLWGAYVARLASVMRRPPWAMVTKLRVVTDPKSQFKDVFEPVKPLVTELLAAVRARVEEAKAAIAFPYGIGAEEGEAEPARRRQAAGRPAKPAPPPPKPAKPRRAAPPADAPLRTGLGATAGKSKF